MPYRKTLFELGQPIHLISRAVDEREIFKYKDDCYRFIFQIYAANIGSPGGNLQRKDVIKIAQAILEGDDIPSKLIVNEHPPLVSFLDFSLVVNHYHFQVIPNFENSLPLYIKKLNGGFAKYFNLKYKRKGTLFGSRYKSIPITTDFQSNAVMRYINVINVLDVFQPGWREKGLLNWEEAFDFLVNYSFSSFPDRIGKRNSKIVGPKEILEQFSFNQTTNKETYEEFVQDFLKNETLRSRPFLSEGV